MTLRSTQDKRGAGITGGICSARKSVAIYAITRHGIEHACKLAGSLPDADLYVSAKLMEHAPEGAKTLPLPMGPLLSKTFTAYDCHVFVISVGAVVRMIAPLLRNKKVDPAVICVDDSARYSICVLSGHVGRGNEFSKEVASVLNAAPIITTASDVIGTLTVDILGRDLGWTLDDMDRNVTRGCASVVNAAPTLFIQETGEPDWWPRDRSLPAGVKYTTSLEGVDPDDWEILLIATDRNIRLSAPDHWNNSVIYRPKSLSIGLGCDRDTDPGMLERGVRTMLDRHGLSIKSVRELATIDKKQDEPAILALAEAYEWPLRIYTAEELDLVEGIENPSEVVKKYVGTRSVSEAASILAAGARNLTVPKQKYTEPDAEHSMTMAVSRVPFFKREVTDG